MANDLTKNFLRNQKLARHAEKKLQEGAGSDQPSPKLDDNALIDGLYETKITELENKIGILEHDLGQAKEAV